MDPIVSPLVAGAAVGTKDTASEAVKDAYHSLKNRLMGKNAKPPPAFSPPSYTLFRDCAPFCPSTLLYQKGPESLGFVREGRRKTCLFIQVDVTWSTFARSIWCYAKGKLSNLSFEICDTIGNQ